MPERSEAQQEALDQRLMDGINTHNPALVSSALMGGADPNNPDRMPFCIAAGYGNIPILRMLADAGGDPALADDNGSTPLIYAIANSEAAACDYLLQRFPNQPLANEQTSALQNCLTPSYQEEMMVRLMDAGANPHDPCPHDTRNFTSFDVAVERELGDALRLMNQYNRESLPPIHHVTHEEVAAPGNALLQHPHGWNRFASICAKLKENGTPLTKADLTQTFGDDDSHSYLKRAVECYRLCEAVEYLNGRGEQITNAELLTEQGEPNALLTACIERQGVDGLMLVGNWKGHSNEELQAFYRALPQEGRDQIDNYHGLSHRLRSDDNAKQKTQGR